ncbi:hypothetical protein [Defluviitalea phaphyphila]|uniref:hypothetical protein n=1 Tax=Defluviitalea phaphyphila TaxID=1473580 RepID=UPI0007309374|nr:hypothetical protein [Defluviitalea phaphyphila]
MKDIIEDRLKSITDLNERRLLREILVDVYENVIDYNMNMYERLEKRIYDEIEDPLDKFYIYSCVDLVSNIDPINDFLHPMIPSDLENPIYDMNEINKKLQNNMEVVLTSVFMECDFLTLKEIVSSNKKYKGYIKTDKDMYEIDVKLKHCKKYINEIEKLYRIFQFNAVRWNTINCPYAYKFIDIILASSFKIKDGEKIKEISIDLGEYEKYKVVNAIPLWNIRRISIEDKSFPMPAGDRINYEHKIPLIEAGIQNGYLIDEDNIDFLYVKREKENLVVVSSCDEQHTWNLIKIESPSNVHKKTYKYELMSNKRTLGFIGRYSSIKSIVIRTKGEIAKLMKSYEISKDLHFVDVEILDKYDREKQTQDYNSFVDDNLRIDKNKKILLVKFKAEDRENFLVLDKMSFLVSELQILFPEYYCIGELV